VGRARVRYAPLGERPARRELVVGGNEGARPVEDPDACTFEPCEFPEADLDPVQPLGDVEPANREVAGTQGPERLGRRQDDHVGLRVRERDVCRGASMGD
jgi:hypothetical protein